MFPTSQSYLCSFVTIYLTFSDFRFVFIVLNVTLYTFRQKPIPVSHLICYPLQFYENARDCFSFCSLSSTLSRKRGLQFPISRFFLYTFAQKHKSVSH